MFRVGDKIVFNNPDYANLHGKTGVLIHCPIMQRSSDYLNFEIKLDEDYFNIDDGAIRVDYDELDFIEVELI